MALYFRYFFLCCFLLLFTSQARAQDMLTLHGVIKDLIDIPVPAASVSIVRKNGSGVAFTTTDAKGLFKCNFTGSQDSLFLKVTALGYQQLMFPITLTRQEPYELTLKKSVQQLKEVVIKSNSKIQLSSDTLKYNVAAFKDRNDRVIADLIARLPGIKIDEKGAISYNGKPISNVYIDGDNLLDGRYRIATNNVPVAAVEQVQVIERDQPIKALNGFVLANRVSLNLKLSDTARTMTINTGYAALGNKAYAAELNNLILQKKIKSINNLKANNTGLNLQAENVSLGAVANDNAAALPATQPYLALGTETEPVLDEKYYLKNNDFAGNVNTLFKLKSDWNLRLNMASLQLKQQYHYNNTINYFLPDADTMRYQEIQDQRHRLNQWLVQAQVEKNSGSVYLKSVTRIDIPHSQSSGIMLQDQEILEQSQPRTYRSISNETSLVKALGADHIFQYNSVLQYDQVKESLKLLPGVQKNVVNDGVAYAQLEQHLRNSRTYINQTGTYKTKFNQFVLSAAAGISFERNTLISNLLKTDSNGPGAELGMQFRNNLVFDHLSLFTKVNAIYLLNKGSVSVEVSPAYNFIHYTDPEKTYAKRNGYFLWNPLFEFRKNVGRYSEFNIRYAQQTIFGQINDVYQGTILLNYREFRSNETPLPVTGRHSIGVKYNYRKPLNMFFYNLNFSYDRSKQNFINSYTIDSGITRSVAIDFNNKSDKYNLSGGMSKYLFFLGTNLSAFANVDLQKGMNLYNAEISPFSAYNLSLSVTARKKISAKMTVTITAENGQFINEQKTKDNQRIVQRSSLNKITGEWQHQVNELLSYQIAYRFNSFIQSKQDPVVNHFLDLNVKYAPAQWKSYFEFQVTNLLNQQMYTQINSSSNQLSFFQTPLRSRTFLLKYVFSF